MDSGKDSDKDADNKSGEDPMKRVPELFNNIEIHFEPALNRFEAAVVTTSLTSLLKNMGPHPISEFQMYSEILGATVMQDLFEEMLQFCRNNVGQRMMQKILEQVELLDRVDDKQDEKQLRAMLLKWYQNQIMISVASHYKVARAQDQNAASGGNGNDQSKTPFQQH